jgi:predicted DNA-binding WGR domain protein
MARTFHFADGRSDKFWSIELQGASHTVHFGRTGTAGQRQTKAFASEAEARKSHDRLIREKLAKGYVEGDAPPAEPPPLEPGVIPPAWREALHVFGVDDDEIEENAFQDDNLDPEWAFSCLVTDSPSGVSTDWRGEQDYSLQVLADAMERMGVRVEMDTQDISRLEVAITAGGATTHYVREMPEEWEDFNGLVFALAEVLPPAVAIYAVRMFEDTDGWGHAVLPAADWERVRALLGPAAFERLFTVCPPSEARFEPSERQRRQTWAEWVQGVLANRRDWVKRCKGDLKREQQEATLLIMRQGDPKHWTKHFTRHSPEMHKEFLDSFRSAARLAYARRPLSRLAELRRTRGAVQVLEGKPNGWAEYHAGMRTYYWMARLDDWAIRSSLGGSSVEMRDAAEFLADCLVLGEWEMARWMFGRILDGRWVAGGGHLSTQLYPLTLRLCALLEGVPFSKLPSTDPLGPYRAVFDAWKKPDALAKALTEVGEYHARQARRPGYSEFEYFPLSVMPLEILAVLRTRRRLGLTVPDVQHPILDTPLGRPPETAPTMPDDLLDLLIQTMEDELGPDCR